MQLTACTADHLRSQAQRNPGALALHERGVDLRYGELDLLVRRCARELRALGLRAGERVAVGGTGLGLGPQLVVLLAAESLGCVTASVLGPDAGTAAVLARVQHWFSDADFRAPAGVTLHRFDQAFVQRWQVGLPDEGGGPLDAARPARLASTSGSSGAARLLALSHAVLDLRIRTLLEVPGWDLVAGTRLLVLAPLVVNASYLRICGWLRRGGAVLVGSGAAIGTLAPTHVAGLPAQVARLLDELPAGHAAPRPVAVSTIGGRVPAALAARVRAVFGTEVENRYGTNETSTVCVAMDAQATGQLDTGVAVRILDDTGREVAEGRDGLIAVRSPCMVTGYLDDPQASAAAFRDGWFLTGDVGRLVAPRLLQLLGRHDDLVVLGGIKVPAAVLEDELRRHPIVADCAVVALHGDGQATLAVAVVPQPPTLGAREVAGRLAGALPPGPDAGWRLVVLPALPRLPGGKLDRLHLLRQLAASRS
ncbi:MULTISPECIES: class I adenylate-forming enzyme family protein [Ramlibacter]|uniref:AMP-binding protein n=1 Tax=Ramlibacter pinisoli TaxID=2682844 RepID=A0A6N8IPZ3_9BURK|nr:MULTISPECIES: class I adenylate-forming enzyme family protein [Ramlibacter]MBA2963932.1 acyl--CoA ligase [Ramlibacter sp. CGMCC 1.13660]MVQ28898.1 AMP-binding protein [Ramlibacter pinisoli]